MNNHPRFQAALKFVICLLLLASTPINHSWADEADQQAENDMKAEQKKAEAERDTEEAEIKDQFSYTFDDVYDKLVIIECKGSHGAWSGSGFIAAMDGKTYIFTNQHIVLGADTVSFKTAKGDILRPRVVELSAERDIARLLIEDREALAISDNISMSAPLAVFGNSEGGGVATELYGKVTGVGADLVEVSAEFVSGNSGSPVLNQNKEVIGIASYVRHSQPSRMKKGTRFEDKVRRFCYRLTNVRWARVNWKKYNAEYGSAYRENEAMVETILNVVNGLYDEPFGRVTENYTDSALARWSVQHNRAVNSAGNQRRTDVHKSTKALADFCNRRARNIKLNLETRGMTGFLREESEGFMYSFEYASEAIDYFNTKLPAL